ncbi:protein SYS1 homolog [Fagus crenata]
MFYGAVVWDPWLIVAQILCLQCLYYLTLGVFLTFLVGTRVSRMSLVYFFDYAAVTTSTVTAWCVIASFLLSSFAGAGYMLHLIERAKKCLDFSATVYIVHPFICIIFGGWPTSLTWWAVNGTGIAVMALQGEYLCIRRELREIPFTTRNLDLIERAKKCLDFSATVYIVHLCICIIHGGWPTSLTWWAVNGTGIAVMALLGEYLCIRRELREIPITTRYLSSKNFLLYVLIKINFLPPTCFIAERVLC